MGSPNELLFLDCETGGLDAQRDALLSIGLVHWSDGEIKNQSEVLVQPEGRNVEPKALQVNRINMAVHRRTAISRREAGERMYRLVRAWFPWSNEKDRIILAGHNIGFDIAFTRSLFNDYWTKLVVPRSVDTSSLLILLEHAGRIPPETSYSLDRAIRLFGLQIEDHLRHTALGDAKVTAELYTKLVGLIATEDVRATQLGLI